MGYYDSVWTSEQMDLTTSPMVDTQSIPAEIPPKLQAPPIALINVVAFKWACKMEGSVTFQLNIAQSDIKGRAV